MRTVKVAGVDVIDTAADGLAQHGECGGAVARWPEDTLAGQLHGAVSHAVHGEVGVGKGERAPEILCCWNLRCGHGVLLWVACAVDEDRLRIVR